MIKIPTKRHSDLFLYDKLSDDHIRQYQEQGFLNIGPILTESGLQHMREQAMKAWAAEKDEFDPDKNWLQNALLPDIHHKAEVVRQYYFSGPFVDVAEQVIGPNIKTATSQLTFKMRGNDMTFAWHQDNAYGELDPYNAISCLTALDDADLDNGCLWLVPGSHQDGQTDFELTGVDRQARRPVVLDVDESRAIPVPMKAGEGLFFHCHMLHKSEGNRAKDRDRRILFLRYADADAVEVYNDGKPRLGRLIRGHSRFPEVRAFETDLPLD